jgi:hypothetical protein
MVKHFFQNSALMNVKQFSLSLGLKPLAEVNLTLVYEYALERQNNKYNHVININPGKKN